MKIKSDKEQHRRIFLIVGIVMVCVLIVWGLQLNEMFKKVATSVIADDISNTSDSIDRGMDLSEQIKEAMPFLQAPLSDITQQQTNSISDGILSEIGNKMNNKLQNNENIEQEEDVNIESDIEN